MDAAWPASFACLPTSSPCFSHMTASAYVRSIPHSPLRPTIALASLPVIDMHRRQRWPRQRLFLAYPRLPPLIHPSDASNSVPHSLHTQPKHTCTRPPSTYTSASLAFVIHKLMSSLSSRSTKIAVGVAAITTIPVVLHFLTVAFRKHRLLTSLPGPAASAFTTKGHENQLREVSDEEGRKDGKEGRDGSDSITGRPSQFLTQPLCSQITARRAMQVSTRPPRRIWSSSPPRPGRGSLRLCL
jgi:hypothetical protein